VQRKRLKGLCLKRSLKSRIVDYWPYGVGIIGMVVAITKTLVPFMFLLVFVLFVILIFGDIFVKRKRTCHSV
jgi:uncharacterized paraquat-inducible protein A